MNFMTEIHYFQASIPFHSPERWISLRCSGVGIPPLVGATGAYQRGDFTLKDDAKSWPLLCHIDIYSGKINVSPMSHILSDRVSLFPLFPVK